MKKYLYPKKSAPTRRAAVLGLAARSSDSGLKQVRQTPQRVRLK